MQELNPRSKEIAIIKPRAYAFTTRATEALYTNSKLFLVYLFKTEAIEKDSHYWTEPP